MDLRLGVVKHVCAEMTIRIAGRSRTHLVSALTLLALGAWPPRDSGAAHARHAREPRPARARPGGAALADADRGEDPRARRRDRARSGASLGPRLPARGPHAGDRAAGAAAHRRPRGSVSAPLAGVPEVQAGGQGALDVALSPNFETDRLVYLSVSEPGRGGAGTAVVRGRLGERGLEGTQVIWAAGAQGGRSQPLRARGSSSCGTARCSSRWVIGSRTAIAPRTSR